MHNSYERRRTLGLHVADFSKGYLRMVPAYSLVTPWYMLGDHGPFSPVLFR